ncbi:MAG: HAD family phosphatase [Acidobacteria bacterium]|nr:MAG: HAD family phosphatase [Acidobacteriota bacterium]
MRAMKPSPPTIEAVALDLDGVLVDSEGINVEAARRAFAALGVALDDEDAALIVGRHPRDYLADLARRHPEAAAVLDGIAARQQRIYDELSRTVRPVPGALELVAGLRSRGLPLALATSSNRSAALAALEALGLAGAFAAVLALEDVTRRKPDPEIYRRASRALGVPPTRVLAVEDSPPGCRAARDAGLVVAAFDPRGRLDASVPADLRVRSLGAVLDWLDGRAAPSAAR